MKMTKTGKTSVDYISYERKITDGASGNNGEWQQAERVVKDTLQDIGKKIEASDSLKQRVDFQLENRLKEEHKMKHMSMKKGNYRCGSSLSRGRNNSGGRQWDCIHYRA